MRPLSSPHLGDWNRVCKPSWTGWGPSANTIDSCWRDPGRCLEIFFAPLCGFIRAFARIIDQHHFSPLLGFSVWLFSNWSIVAFLGSVGKESTCNAGALGLIPGLGRKFPGGGNSYPLQYSGLENSMDCIVHGVTKSQTRLSDFHFQPVSTLFCLLRKRQIRNSGKTHFIVSNNVSSLWDSLIQYFFDPEFPLAE